MENREAKSPGGLRLQIFSYAIAGMAFLISFLLLLASLQASSGYTELMEDTERLLDARQNALDMQMASDYLTGQVQTYTVTEDWKYVEQFLEEVTVTRRREKALENLTALGGDQESLEYLSQAMERSRGLMQTEYRAIRLILEAGGEAPGELPAELEQVELTKEEQALLPEEKRGLAIEMVFGEEYRQEKQEINQAVAHCTDRLTKRSQENQAESSEMLRNTIRKQLVLIVALLLVMILLVIMVTTQILSPLRKNVRAVREGTLMESTGAYEMRFLAESYNDILARNQQDKAQLSYEATHDPLTGLYNRKAYEQALEENDERSLTLILVDVDRFKQVNDTYGHEAGDRLLKRVASVLHEHFRSEDYVCRIGGDEFAVLMVNATSVLEPLVAAKIRDVTRILREQEGDIPAATLSVGIAFGDRRGSEQTLFQSADRALYDVKEHGKDGWAFFGEHQKEAL